MEVISVMLVFEPDDHTALKSVIISDNPSVCLDAARDCTFMWFLLFSIIIFTGSSPLAVPPSAGNCYNEQGNDRPVAGAWLRVLCLRNLRNNAIDLYTARRVIHWICFSVLRAYLLVQFSSSSGKGRTIVRNISMFATRQIFSYSLDDSNNNSTWRWVKMIVIIIDANLRKKKGKGSTNVSNEWLKISVLLRVVTQIVIMKDEL